ncbi:MAG: PD-(D/E)XK nuclease family protein [Bacteroidota bacterium]|nr:PD-(D/E)XK nuclease family protein [Bacteroidota bacterium]
MNDSFLHEVVRSLSNQNWEEMCFIVPNKRSALYLTQSVISQLDEPTIAPEILDIDSFIRSLSNMEAPPKMELLFTLYHSYCEHIDPNDRDDFVRFLGWGETLLGDLDAIDKNLLDRQEVFGLLMGMQEVKAWGSNDNALVQKYIGFWKKLPKIHHSFSTALLQKGHGTSGMLYREAVRNLEVFLDAHPKKTFIICGFNVLTDSESILFQSILAQNRGKIYWDADEYFLSNAQELSGLYLNKYKQWPYYQNQPFLGLHNSFVNEKEVEIIETTGLIAQAKQVGSLLKDLSSSNPRWERVAVVLPDESLLNPILHALPPEVSKINITMGTPLQQQSISIVIEALFDMHMTHTTKGFYYKTVEKIFSHKLIRTYCKKKGLNDPVDLVQTIIQKNQRFLNVKQLEEAKLANYFGFLFSLWQKPKEAVESICKLLKMLLPTADTDDSQQLESIHLFLTLFYQLDHQLRTYSFITNISELRAIYNAQIGTHKLSFSGEALKGLQIMGMLETRLLDFDTVILTQANEGILPSKAIDDSWIPYDMKKQYGLPTRDEKNAIFSYHFFRLMYRAKKVYILYDGQDEGLGGGEISRFVRQWTFHNPAKHNISFYTQKVALNTTPNSQIIIPKTESLRKSLAIMGEKGLSATTLSNYILDPIRFYNNSILRISETEELEESMTYQSLGTAIHNALEELYEPYVGKELTIGCLEKMLESHKEILTIHFEKKLGKDSHKTGKNLLIFTASAYSIKRVIEADKKDIVGGSTIELLGLEEYRKITRTYAGIEHPISFHGVIDRIDRKDGILRILDYKTGKTEPKELRPKEITDCLFDAAFSKSFQVMFYSMLWSEDNQSTLFKAGVISVKNMSAGVLYLTLGTDTKRTDLYTTDLDVFEKHLEQMVIEIYNPDIPFKEAD